MNFNVILNLFWRFPVSRIPDQLQNDVFFKRLIKSLFFGIRQFIIFSLYLNPLYAQNAGDIVFSGNLVHTFIFHFDQPAFLDSLYRTNHDKDYTIGHVTINGVYYDSVGVRFKGSSSFNGYPGHKKSFRIKFHEYKDYKFDGLRRINLNNGWSDPSMLREKLFLDFLYEQGITAPRANFARVYIDSAYWGLYTMVEQVDKTFLKHRYSENDGNLYKAMGQSQLDWKGSDAQNYYPFYDLKTNEKENDRSDLTTLLDAINNSTAGEFSFKLDSIFTIEEFIRAWAANNFIINLDSYFGSANNFYLYHNENSGKFNWILWDTNLTFGGRTAIDSLDLFWMPGTERPLIKNLLNHNSFREMYLQSVYDINLAMDEQQMFKKIDELFALIKPYYFADTLKMYSNEQAENNLDYLVERNPGLKTFIINRKANITKQLKSLLSPVDFPQNIIHNFKLYQNFPNPFNGQTVIPYELSRGGYVALKVYDINGREVQVLVNQYKSAGKYMAYLDGSQLASGIYFYRHSNPPYQQKKLILLK
jgi:spore coat protein CotH